LRGIRIDFSDENGNANDSIRINREFDSKKNNESEEQHEKHSQQKIPTLDGIILIQVMNLKMQMIQFVSIVNLIQMKLGENTPDPRKASV
jgi:hypothetical protein